MKILLLEFVLITLCCAVSGTEQCISELPPDPNSQCCGIDVTTSNRIVGGEPASLRQYPWLGLVEYKFTMGNKPHVLCGAFLISSRYVVTAAHCVSGSILDDFKPIAIRLGDYDKTNPGEDCVNLPGGRDCTTAISVPIEKITVHENYDSNRVVNDIALIRLKKLAPYTDHIRPICLPNSDVSVKAAPNLNLQVAGWGIMKQIKKPWSDVYQNFDSNIKRHVTVPHMSYKKCRRVWPQISKSQICAGGNGKDSCMGDSGGPLMYNREGVYEAVGVVSFGTGEPCGRHPGVYTKVFDSKTWIMKHIQS